MNEQTKQLSAYYGHGDDGSNPRMAQWDQILDLPSDQPITLINFFKLRDLAVYKLDQDNGSRAITGKQAFDHYASISIPAMERIGGKFLHVGPFAGTFIGDNEDWDIIAIGTYPDRESFLALYTDKEYREAFVHRTAACDRQKVLVCTNPD